MTGSSSAKVGFGRGDREAIGNAHAMAGIDDHLEAQQEARMAEAARQATADEATYITDAYDLDYPFCAACNKIHPVEAGCDGYKHAVDLIAVVHGGDSLQSLLEEPLAKQRGLTR